MITGTEIYWLTRLQYFKITINVILFIGAIGSGFFIFYPLFEEDFGPIKSRIKYICVCVVCCLFAAISAILIPNIKEIVAIYLLPKIVNNKDVKQIPSNTAKVLNLKLKQWLSEEFGDEKNTGN